MFLSSFCRIYNYEPVTPLKLLRANLYGKFVAIRGTVVRVSNIKPLCTKMAFVCNLCGDVQSVALPDGKYTVPTKVSVFQSNLSHLYIVHCMDKGIWTHLLTEFMCFSIAITNRCNKFFNRNDAF